MRGAALIAAVLVAAVVAAVAVTLTTRDRYAILGVMRLEEQARASTLLRKLEIEAAAVLAADLEQSRHDDESETWARAEFAATGEGFDATARLRDAQRLFNLNALAFQPPESEAAGTPEDDVPPPIDEAPAAAPDDGAASRALSEALSGVSDLAPASDDTQPDAETPADGAAAEAPALSAQQVGVARFTLLLQALDLPPEILPAILDWLDADSDTRFPNGAEDEHYTRLNPPYRAANGPFADISELRLVHGITPEIYATLAPHVTALGNNVPLNVNTASTVVLMSLGPGIDRATADLLVTSRAIEPWASVDALLRHPLLAGRPLLARGLTARSNWFELRARIDGEAGPLFRRTLFERLSPSRILIQRRERHYTGE